MHDNLFKYFEMQMDEVSPERTVVSMPVSERTANGMGFVHGGAIYSLVDVAFGAAANEGEKTGTVTLSSHITYLAAGRKGPIVAEATRVRHGRTVVVYAVDVRDADGTLIAHATCEGFRTDYPFVKAE